MNVSVGRALRTRKCTVARGLITSSKKPQPRCREFRSNRCVRKLTLTACLTTSGTASCLAAHPTPQEHTKPRELALPAQAIREAPCNVAWRLLRRLRRMLKLLMRALALVSVWLPVAVSGLTVDLLERLPVFPEKLSARLRYVWWTVLLKAIDMCGPTFIKVGAGPCRLAIFYVRAAERSTYPGGFVLVRTNLFVPDYQTFFFFFAPFYFPAFWTSRGHRCRPFFPPVVAFNFFRA